MSVFLSYSGSYEDRHVVAVYSTLEDAQEAHEHDEWDDDGLSCVVRRMHHRRRLPLDVYFKTVTVPVVNGVATLGDGRTVQSDAKYVSYPVLRDDIEYVIEDVLGDQCDYMIEEMPYDPD